MRGDNRANPLVEAIVTASFSEMNCKPDCSTPIEVLRTSTNASMTGFTADRVSAAPSSEIRIDVTFASDCCHSCAVRRSVKMAGAVVPAS